MKIVVRIILLFTCIPLLYLSVESAILKLSRDEFYDDINKRIETAFTSATGAVEPDLTLMTHRMITSDIQDGLISPQDAKRAFGNTAGYFNEVKRECLKESTQQTKDILSCANKILGDHFYYYPARESATAWAGHYSDCDSNVYLLLDALQLFNKTASIVYAPGHAFISWTDEMTGLPAWWETTSDANHGRPADLSRNDLYRKTMVPFYYLPQSAHYAEQFYTSVVTLQSLPEELKQKRLNQAVRQYPNNPFVDDIRYSLKESFSETDISQLHEQLLTDVSSVTKTFLLANYYSKGGDDTMATYYINKIDIDNCDAECRNIMVIAHPSSRIWFIASDISSKQTVKNKYGEFDVSKRIFPPSAIKEAIYSINEFSISMLFLLGMILLYIGIKLGQIIKRS
ncbi:TPA: hypothetical protein QHX34_002719 [Klebsiella aerogenes]|nr:hypothetical protein [Klebsiella aerogenes]